jgi:hypothetical protein
MGAGGEREGSRKRIYTYGVYTVVSGRRGRIT